MVKMARRRYGKRRGSRSKKIPMAVTVPMAIPMIRSVGVLMSGGSTENMGQSLAQIWAGIGTDGKVHGDALAMTYVPILAGVIVHKAAGRLGVNRYIPKSIPLSI